MNDFLKKLSFILTKIFTKKALIYVIFFLLFILLKSKSFAYEFTYDNKTYETGSFINGNTYTYNLCILNPGSSDNNKCTMYGSNTPFYLKWRNNSSSDVSVQTFGQNNQLINVYYDVCGFNTTRFWHTSGTFQSNELWSGYSSNQTVIDSLLYCDFNLLMQNRDGSFSPIYTIEPIYENLPYILNDIESLAIGGQSVVIMPGDFPNTKEIRFTIQEKTENGGIISYNNLFTPIVLNASSSYYVSPPGGNGTGFYYSIPWNFISQYLSISKTYNFVIAYEINGSTEKQEKEIIYGGSTPDDALYNQGLILENSINEQTNAINNQTQVIENQTNVIQQQTQAIQQQTNTIEENTQATEHLENTITDSSIESGAEDLPTTDVQDPTQNGIDNIFQSIYNAFCTGQAQDIIFPIPFTNKNITLSPYYVRDMLNNNGASWIYTLIQAFWGYIIGRFIIKDISKKLTKIKSGNIENIENENIKEDML